MIEPWKVSVDSSAIRRKCAGEWRSSRSRCRVCQKVAWADNAIKLAVEMTVASIGSLELSGSTDEQAVQVRDAIRIVFPEAVTLVREAREGLQD